MLSNGSPGTSTISWKYKGPKKSHRDYVWQEPNSCKGQKSAMLGENNHLVISWLQIKRENEMTLWKASLVVWRPQHLNFCVKMCKLYALNSKLGPFGGKRGWKEGRTAGRDHRKDKYRWDQMRRLYFKLREKMPQVCEKGGQIDNGFSLYTLQWDHWQ